MYFFEKLGLVFCPESSDHIMKSHASNPIAINLKNDMFRVFFNSRDANQRSHIWFLDMVVDEKKYKIIEVSKKPILEPGTLGTFDDSGVSIGCVTVNDNQTNLYYMGWNLSVTVPWRNSIGLAIQNPISGLFEKHSLVPMIDRNKFDPFTISYPCVLKDGEIWKMWYGSNLSWGNQQSDMSHVIKYAWSNDGINWNIEGKISLNLNLPEEYALCRPWVIKDKGIFKMWFCFRGEAYRIGYAESHDGIIFARKKECIIDVSETGWDSKMVCYPSIFRHRNNLFMLYNGNDYGKTGFGLAVLNERAN